MVICERPGFWRWLAQASVGAISLVPWGIGYIFKHIKNPICEMVLGVTAFVLFSVCAVFDFVIVVSDTGKLVPWLTLTTRVIAALLAVPSFLIMMHGIYRMGDDC